MAKESHIKGNKMKVPNEPAMPKSEATRLIELMKQSHCYLEYGTGGSTIKAIELKIPYIVIVESDIRWLQKVNKKIRKMDTKDVFYYSIYSNIGKIGKWGTPLNDKSWKRYWHYSFQAWDVMKDLNLSPDLIFIDGRFRVACILTSLLYGKIGTRILVDDYVTRDYHTIEKYIKPIHIIGRMAEFIITEYLPTDDIWRTILMAVTDPR
jgi:hypothetical protein